MTMVQLLEKKLVRWMFFTSYPLSTEDLEQFYELVDSESVFDDFGYQHYVECRELLNFGFTCTLMKTNLHSISQGASTIKPRTLCRADNFP